MAIDDSALKSQFLGRDQFTWWIGQVAHPKTWRDDKTILKNTDSDIDLGLSWAYRCKVRIIGYHPFSGNELADEDLPWAHVMVPAAGGSGHGALGESSQMVGGETVFGFFMDGDEGQQPVVFGALHRNPNAVSTITSEEILKEKSSRFRPYSGIAAQSTMQADATQRPPKNDATLSTPKDNANNERKLSSGAAKNPDQIFPESDAETQFAAGGQKTTIPNGCEQNFLSDITNTIRSFIATTNSLTEFLGVYVDAVQNFVEDIGRIISKTGQIIMGIMKKIFNNLRDRLMKWLGKRFRDFVALFVPEPQQQPIANAIKKIMDIIFCIFEKLGVNLLSFIKNFLKDLVGKTIAAPLCAAEQATAAMVSAMLKTLNGLLKPIMDGISWLTGALSSVMGALSSVSSFMNQLLSFLDCDSLECRETTDWSSGWGLNTQPAQNISGMIDKISIMDDLITDGEEMTLDELAAEGADFSFLTIMGGQYAGFVECNNLRDNPRSQDDIGESPPGFIFPTCIPPKVEFVGDSRKKAQGYPIVAQDGSILAIVLTSGGRGYDAPPSVSIIDKTNHGGGAVVEAILDDRGQVVSTVIRDPGTGYCPSSIETDELIPIPDPLPIPDFGPNDPDTTPPGLSLITPPDNSVGVSTLSCFTFEFNEPIKICGNTVGKIRVIETETNFTHSEIDVTNSQAITFLSDKRVKICPPEPLKGSTNYHINIDQGAFCDISGNPYVGIANTTTYNITTQVIAGVSSVPVGIATNIHVDRPGLGYTSGDTGRYGDNCTFDLVLNPQGSIIGIKNLQCSSEFTRRPDVLINTNTGTGAELLPIMVYTPNTTTITTTLGPEELKARGIGIINKIQCPGS